MNETKLKFRDWLATQADDARRESDRLEAVRRWVAELDELYMQIEKWLHEDDAEQILKVSGGRSKLREEDLGRYEAPTRSISLRGRTVDLIPVARAVLGPIGMRGDPGIRAEGRVDMTNGAEKYMLYLAIYPTGPRWVIVDDDTYTVRDLDRDTFEEALQELLS